VRTKASQLVDWHENKWLSTDALGNVNEHNKLLKLLQYLLKGHWHVKYMFLGTGNIAEDILMNITMILAIACIMTSQFMFLTIIAVSLRRS